MATQVWNGRKEDWRGCPPPLALVEGAWPLRVEFAKEDRVDNHYLVAGRLADLPARAVVPVSYTHLTLPTILLV